MDWIDLIKRQDKCRLKKTHLYADYKRLTSDLKTPAHWKWIKRKRYSMQTEDPPQNKSCGSNIYIKQNRLQNKDGSDKERQYLMING